MRSLCIGYWDVGHRRNTCNDRRNGDDDEWVDDDDDRRNVGDERHIMMKCLSLQFAHASSDCQFQWEISFQQINRLVQS